MNFRNLLLIVALVFSQTLTAQVTRVQVINNCPDVSLSGVDVYIDGQLLANDVFFRNSTPFFDVNTGNSVRINVTEMTAFDTMSSFYNTNISLNSNDKYILVVSGIKSTSGYTPQTPFSIEVYTAAKEVPGLITNTDALFFNGCTDLPAFDARTGINTIAKNLGYATFDNDYYSLPANGTFNIRFTNDRGNVITHNFEDDFGNLGLSSDAILVLTSGFVNTAANSNGPSFGLWAASANGGALQEIQSTTNKEPLARIQFIHNTADTGVGKVDVHLNNMKRVDTLNYHYASPFLDINSGSNIPLELSYPGQSAFFNTNVNIDSGKTYIAVIHGIKSDTNYKPLPPFKVSIFNDGREEATNTSNTDVLIMHGATDVANVDVNQSTNKFADDIAYGNFNSGYTSFASASPGLYHVDTNNSSYYPYTANYNAWGATGLTATVVTSGFITPDSNSMGPLFGLWAATSNGGAMYQLPLFGNVNELKAHSNQLNIWPNPANTVLSFDKKSHEVDLFITDLSGRVIGQKEHYNKNQIDVSGLAGGQYFIIVIDNNERYISNFIKQ